jgi:hypothetical protein
MTTNIQPTSTPAHIRTVQPVEEPPFAWVLSQVLLHAFQVGGARLMLAKLGEFRETGKVPE